MLCPRKPAGTFPQYGEAQLQEELPELWRERVWLVDDCGLEGCHASVELLPHDISVNDRRQVRESLAVGSGAQQGSAGANDIENIPGKFSSGRQRERLHPLPRKLSPALPPSRPWRRLCCSRAGI